MKKLHCHNCNKVIKDTDPSYECLVEDLDHTVTLCEKCFHEAKNLQVEFVENENE